MNFKPLLIVLFYSSFVSAADPEVVPVRKGDQVPFTGVLLTPEGVAKTIAESDARVEAEVAKQQHTCNQTRIKLEEKCAADKISCSANEQRVKAELESCKRLEVEYVKKIENLEKNWPNVWSWFWMGAASGAVVTGVTFFVISSLVQ